MKTIRRLLIILLLAMAVATGVSYINNDVIVSDWVDKAAEIGVLTMGIFIILALLYFVNRAVFRTVKGIGKKKPPFKGGPEI